MPELPDVEGFRRYLAKHAQGRRIVRVDVPDRAIVRNRSPQALERTLAGAEFAPPERHGKWLIAPVDAVELLLHFGMTGELRFAPDQGDRHAHDRVIFVCEGGELRYNNMRRFGGVWLASDRAERDRVIGPLGPDAATLGRAEFVELLRGRRGGVKAALMDQRLIAGVGNLLADEIAWRAHVHPATPVASLGPARVGRLYDALHDAVRESIRYGRVPHGTRWLTRVRDDRAARCPRCATRLRWATIAGRTACWCPRCQSPAAQR
jgi:formamidopyrimidine-DNA glycosylase